MASRVSAAIAASLIAAAVVVATTACASRAVVPTTLAPRVSTSVTVRVGKGTVLSLAIPSHELPAGGVATMTASLTNTLETTGEAPDVTVVISDARGGQVSAFAWIQDARRRADPICERCHVNTAGPPMPAGTKLVWPFRFVVPGKRGRYTAIAAASLSDTSSASPPLAFDSATASGAFAPPEASSAESRALSPGETQALALMAKYRLHPSGEPRRDGGTLTAEDLSGYAAPSKAIGLDLGRHLSETLQTLAYTLSNPSSGGTVTALFYIVGNQVVGAGLGDERLGGRPVALSDRMDFAP